ncbi:S-layer homology domain-containing protein [Paenibacillus sp. PAMC21692]|uniref:S-layer homology domain-containing protein n=1 Tax=Paenibacillus sp. PAMC21692 TaxID=2762320 RepID=UPI00164DA006|nr:S-layer homology domain-containing protein [Paenibacillus sp. PAMC21692]QNK56161.1 S-layer homology domain-containing protein [Paenibacillus sp. PAMC21692]
MRSKGSRTTRMWRRKGTAAILSLALLASIAVPVHANEVDPEAATSQAGSEAPSYGLGTEVPVLNTLVTDVQENVILIPTDDSFIEGQDEARRDKINGASTSVQVASNNANERIIYLKFDLEDEEVADIGSATLRLFNNDTRYNRVVSAHELSDTSWSESTLTWNNAPPIGGEIQRNGSPVTFSTAATGNADDRLLGAKYYELDVTEYVKAAAGQTELGLVVQSDGFTSFASKEYEGGAYPPQLVLSADELEPPADPVYKELEENGRSSLYPEDWYPGYKDGEGRFLHDFSYAGYRKGLEPIPDVVPGDIVDVTEAPYNADKTGTTDATAAIQAAIDDIGEAGGGVVFLPAGTYRIKPQGTNNQSLKLNRSGVVLRGAGPKETFLFNDEPVMRGKDIITVISEGAGFQAVPGTETNIRTDLPEPTVTIPVQDSSAYRTGDWVTISNRYTTDFIAEHDMADWWATYIGNEGITFYRQVVAIDAETHTLTIDIPTRYPLKVRDSARVYKLNPPVTDVGVEHLSIGNVQNLTPGIGESDDTKEGTAGFQVAGTNAVNFVRVADAWARNVHSYRPASNNEDYDYHLLSSGIHTSNTRNVTIVDCVMQKPLFRGAGGNGYLFELVGNDNLILNAKAVEGRHNYTFSHMRTNGNVIRNSISVEPTHVIDFHQYLSASNLLDGMQLYGDRIEASVRPYPSSQPNYKHGHTTSQTVIWNTLGYEAMDGTGIIVDSRQHGYGYIIGTSGNDAEIRITPDIHSGKITAPIDFAEGIGQGDRLFPSSLYEDQLARRMERMPTELQSIKLGGNPLTGFQPGKRVYDIELPFGTVNVPAIQATTSVAGAAVELALPDSLPGTATLQVTSADGAATALYALHLRAADSPAVLAEIALQPDRTRPGWKSGLKLDAGTEAFLSVTGLMSDGTEADMDEAAISYSSSQPEVLTAGVDGSLEAITPGTANVTVSVTLGAVTLTRTIAVVSAVPVHTDEEVLPVSLVSSSGDDGNVVENVLDGDYDTRWSASGEGQWMMADLGAVHHVGAVSIAFYNGHTRKSKFELAFSLDGMQWTTGYSLNPAGNSNGTTSTFELFELAAPMNARFVKYVGYGNSANAWNSISEIRFHPADVPGPTASPTPTSPSTIIQPTPTPKATISPSPTPVTAAVEATFDGTNKPVIIMSEVASIEAAGDMFASGELGESGKATFQFELLKAEHVNGLSNEARRAIGDRPILDIKVLSDGQTLKWSNPDSPVTVKLPYKPSAAELSDPGLLEKLTIWHLDESGVTQPISNAYYDPELAAFVFRTTHIGRYAPVLSEHVFRDLNGYSWASDEIGVLAARGIIKGTTASTFQPSASVKRADFVTMIVRALGLSARGEASFPDVSDKAYYYGEVGIAERLGIVQGMPGGSFRPESAITREEMIVIAARAMNAARIEAATSAAGNLAGFADAAEVSDYAKESIIALTELGLVNGNGGKLKPQAAATRAEAAALIYRMLQAR